MSETIPAWRFEQPPVFCPKCGAEILPQAYNRHSRKWETRIACEACSIAAAPPAPKPKYRAKPEDRQERFECGSIFID